MLYLIESPYQPEKFGSIPRALWYSVATVAKKYGGSFPVTVAGKLAAAITGLAGIAVVALPTGILASSFVDVFRSRSYSRSPKNQNQLPKII